MINKAVILIPRKTISLIHSEDLYPLSHIGGLPVIMRILYNAQWAGVSEGIVLSYGGWEDIRNHLVTDSKNYAFKWIEHPLPELDSPEKERLVSVLRSPFLLLSSQWILDRKIIQGFCNHEQDLTKGILIDSVATYSLNIVPPASLIDGANHPGLVDLLLKGEDTQKVATLLRTRLSARIRTYAPPQLIKVDKKDDREEAERQLFKGLVKPTESFMSRFVERRISLSFSRRLIHTSITPNQISIFSILVGLLSGFFFLPESKALHVTGAMLLLFSSIIDGCDGEIARLRFQESKWGSWIDFLGDNIVHMVVFFCIGMGLYRYGHGTIYLVLGVVAVVGTLGSASMVFFRVFLKTKEGVVSFATPVRIEEMEKAGGEIRKRIEFADKVSNRDFIWIILAFSLTGWLWLWAWFCAVGVMFYFSNLLNLYLKMRTLRVTSR